MSLVPLLILIVLFFLTTVIGVVTGSNSLITVPVMFQFGIDEKIAVATNMFGLTFMSVGATIPFVRKGKIDYGKVWPLMALTFAGSAAGAALVGVITNQALKLIVSIAMIAVAVFIFWHRDAGGGTEAGREPRRILVYVLAFALAIYGGLYSGGYVTMLTAVLVAFFAMPFGEAVASTKLINVCSSLVATLIFIRQGLVDYKLGVILSVTMFIGAYIGAHYAAKMNETLLRRIFLATVVLLAAKTLYDLSSALFIG
jgi:uncharacterized membrane protein YfcA